MVKIAAKKVAKDPLTACKDPARDVSIVIISFESPSVSNQHQGSITLTFPKRLSIRPGVEKVQ